MFRYYSYHAYLSLKINCSIFVKFIIKIYSDRVLAFQSRSVQVLKIVSFKNKLITISCFVFLSLKNIKSQQVLYMSMCCFLFYQFKVWKVQKHTHNKHIKEKKISIVSNIFLLQIQRLTRSSLAFFTVILRIYKDQVVISKIHFFRVKKNKNKKSYKIIEM